MAKLCLRWLLKILFRVEVKGLEHFHEAGDRVLIVCNHTSLLDPLVIGAFLPGQLTFAINTHIAQRRLFKPIIKLSKVFPLDPTNPLSLKAIIHHLQNNHKTVIFPEGRLTVTGGLMKVYDGTGMVAEKTGANVLPAYIEGAEFSHFSRLQNIVRIRWFPKITLHLLPPTRIQHHPEVSGKARRKLSGQVLSDIMRESVFNASGYQQSICNALLKARYLHGAHTLIVEDLARQPLSYNGLITQSIVIGNLVKPLTVAGEHVGVLLPNSIKTLATIVGLHWHGRVPAMLNFSVGSVAMLSACQTGQVRTIVTSRRFIENANLTNDAKTLSEHINLVYLEDLAQNLSLTDKLGALWQCHFGSPYPQTANDPAVVLFTSGSEGTPKGVVLSHSNVVGNLMQVKSRYDFNPQDVALNFLPMFHSFGFTVGTFLPLLNGMRCFFYPSPLHYSVIPELAYDISATLIFGTNTFLAAYAKKAHPYDFHSIRYVVAGAEKLQSSTRDLWLDKFGIRIMEGYGATETSPVAAVNTPYEHKTGSVGRLMPCMQYQLEAVPGIESGGKLHLAGPNIMKGYLLADNPGVLVPPKSIFGEGWYDTGDIVNIDEEGYVHIQGRSKRFAKISGEMVSLTAVEHMASHTWPGAQHAVVSLPDSKKGEQLVLLTTQKEAQTKQLQATHPGVTAINFPKQIHTVDGIPLLGTGKTDYFAATRLAEQLMLSILEHITDQDEED